MVTKVPYGLHPNLQLAAGEALFSAARHFWAAATFSHIRYTPVMLPLYLSRAVALFNKNMEKYFQSGSYWSHLGTFVTRARWADMINGPPSYIYIIYLFIYLIYYLIC